MFSICRTRPAQYCGVTIKRGRGAQSLRSMLTFSSAADHRIKAGGHQAASFSPGLVKFRFMKATAEGAPCRAGADDAFIRNLSLPHSEDLES